VARKNSLGRNLERNQALMGGQSSSGWGRREIMTEHGQDVQTFIDDQQCQILIITLVVEGATGLHLRSKCQLAFHSRSFRVRDPKQSSKQQVRTKV
jgi:hypothetical protein